MSIRRLPTELIEQIVDDIAPDTHLSFALICGLLRDCSQSMLAHHRACSIEHKEITDVLEDFSRSEDPVAVWHNRACVVYRASSIVKALQIPTLRSLEIRRFDDEYGRDGFEEEELPHGSKSPITELYFHYVPTVSESQLRGLFSSCQALKVIRVDKCSFGTANQLVELAATYHGKTIEAIHFDKNQTVRGGSDYRLYYTPHLKSLEMSLEIRITSVMKPPDDHEIEELDNAFADVLKENQRLLKRLDSSGVEQEYCFAKLFENGGRYLNRLFPHVGGHYVSAAAIGRHQLYPLFPKTIDTGHDLGIMVKTFHHHRGNCKHCEALTWSDDLQKYDSFEKSDAREVCGSLKCRICMMNIFSRDAWKILKPGDDWET